MACVRYRQRSQGDGCPGRHAARVAACTSCHGVRGEGLPGDAKVPRLAGKPAGYLLQQLESFQAGRRRHAAMEYVVRQLSPDYLHQIAEYFAAQPVPYRRQSVPAMSAAALQRGEQLVRHGDPGRGVPACESCHGATLTGVEPMMPGLATPISTLSSTAGAHTGAPATGPAAWSWWRIA